MGLISRVSSRTYRDKNTHSREKILYIPLKMSENAQPERKFARKARKSIMAINSTQQSYKQMRLRNENKNQMPFKAGKIKYEAPKFLSTAMTPPRTRKNFMKKTSSAVNFRTTKN